MSIIPTSRELNLENMIANHSVEQRVKIFIMAFLMLMTAHALSLTLGWFHSVDVKSWWLFALFVNAIVSAAYAGAFTFIVGKLRPRRLQWSFFFNLVLAGLLLLHSVIFYLYRPSWSDTNIGGAELNLFQKIIWGHYTIYWIYLTFLCMATGFVLLQDRLCGQK